MASELWVSRGTAEGAEGGYGVSVIVLLQLIAQEVE